MSPPRRCGSRSTLQDPVMWGQTYLRNRDGSPRAYWPHQVEDLRCDGEEHHPPRRPRRRQEHRAHDRRAAFRLHHSRRPGPRRRAAPGASGHAHRGDRVPARRQPRPDGQHRHHQVRQAQDPPQALLPAGVHQRRDPLLPPGRRLRRRVPLAARRARLGGRGRVAHREGVEGAAPVPQGRRASCASTRRPTACATRPTTG